MDSANHGRDPAAAGILRLLMAMRSRASAPESTPRAGGGLMVVHHFIFGGDGDLDMDLFSGGVGGGGVPPASKAAIASLKEVQAGAEGSLGDCAICLEAFGAGKEMPCGHRFHGDCLERWLGVHGSCPICRHELPKAEPPAEEQQQQQDGDGERRGPRGAVLMSVVVLVGGERPREEAEEEREEPMNIRIEDVD